MIINSFRISLSINLQDQLVSSTNLKLLPRFTKVCSRNFEKGGGKGNHLLVSGMLQIPYQILFVGRSRKLFFAQIQETLNLGVVQVWGFWGKLTGYAAGTSCHLHTFEQPNQRDKVKWEREGLCIREKGDRRKKGHFGSEHTVIRTCTLPR